MGKVMAGTARAWIEAKERCRKEREARVETSIPRQVSWKRASDLKKEGSGEEDRSNQA